MPTTADLSSSDAVQFAEDRLGFHLRPGQMEVMRFAGRQIAVKGERLVGKSTICAVKAAWALLHDPTPGPVVIVAPNQRCARALLLKVGEYLEMSPALVQEGNCLSLTLASGERVVALPGDNRTIPAHSPKILLIDDGDHREATTF